MKKAIFSLIVTLGLTACAGKPTGDITLLSDPNGVNEVKTYRMGYTCYVHYNPENYRSADVLRGVDTCGEMVGATNSEKFLKYRADVESQLSNS